MTNKTDNLTVSHILGHESPVTTGRYDLRLDDAMREACGLVGLPYEKREEI